MDVADAVPEATQVAGRRRRAQPRGVARLQATRPSLTRVQVVFTAHAFDFEGGGGWTMMAVGRRRRDRGSRPGSADSG